jgi:lysophospholipase L1-like esterase
MRKFHRVQMLSIFCIILLGNACKSAPKMEEGAADQMILRHFYNYVQATDDAEGYTHFSRFYPEQLEAYSNNAMYKAMSSSSAGIVLSFITTGDLIQFKVKTTSRLKKMGPIMKQISISSVLYALKVIPKENLLNRKVFLDGIDFVVDGELISTRQPIRGNMKFRFANPDKKKCKVTIYFPAIFEMYIKDLQINGTIEKLPPQETILCLGDSITQGFISGYPSQNYVARLSQKLNVNTVNQGIGGYTYQEQSLNGLEEFNRQFGPPKFITVAYGTNDWYYKISSDELQKNIADYYKHLTAIFPATPVYVITPIWRGDTAINSDTAIPFEQVAELIQKETAAYPTVTLIDGMKLLPHDFAYFADGYLHPNAEGFAIMANNIMAQFSAFSSFLTNPASSATIFP